MKTIQITLDEALLAEVDQVVREQGANRSAFIRHALRLALRQCNNYQISLSGVSKLELITEDAGDGKAVDWGIWFEPTLAR